MTLKLRKEVPSLRSLRVAREIGRSLARVVASPRVGSFRVVQYSLQHDHAHLVVEAAGPRALGRGMKSVGARLARAVNRVFERSGPVLADRYHVRVLRTPREVRNALAYVLLNGRKHAARSGRRLSRVARVDPMSSGAWFSGWRSGVALPERWGASPPVARARTWLLRAGWRRHSLLDPTEVPG